MTLPRLTALACALSILWLVLPVRGQDAPPAIAPPEAPAGDFDRVRLDEHNLSLELAAGRWTRVSVAPKSDDAGSAQWKRSGDLLLVVRSEELSPNGPDDSEAWLRLLCSSIAKDSTAFELVESRPETVAGIDGRRFKIDVKTKASSVRFEGWAGMSKGICYRVGVQGRRTQALLISNEINRVLPRVRLLDEARQSKRSFKRAESPIVSEKLGVRITLPDNILMDEAPDEFDGAADGGIGLRQGGWTFLAVQSINLGTLACTDEEVLEATIERFGLRAPGIADEAESLQAASKAWTKADLGNGARKWTGVFRRGGPFQNISGTNVVIFRGPIVIFVQAWSVVPEHQQSLTEQLIAGVELLPAPAQFPPQAPASELTSGERIAHGVIIGTIANLRSAADDSQGALPLYLKAVEYIPEDHELVDGTLELLEELGQYRQAVALLEKVPGPKDAKSAAARMVVEARLRGAAGDAAGAEAAYQRYFATGRRDDEVLSAYLELLSAADRHDDVLKAIDTLAAGDPQTFIGEKAGAIARKGNLDEALSMLKPVAEATPTNWVALWPYIDLLLEFDRFSEAREFSVKMLEREPGSAGLLVRRGRAEMALGWFGQARDSFESALQKLPGNKTIREDLASATRALGQGDRSLIAKGIQPVAIPEDLLKPSSPPPATDSPVLVDVSARAVAFTPGSPLRTSILIRQKAVTRAGVDELSTMSFDFEPARERIAVNTFRVIDPQGKVTEGDPATYYVTDAESGEASEDKTLVLPATGLTAGSTIEVLVTYETLAPMTEIDYGSMWFGSSVPAAVKLLWIQTPAPIKDHLIWKLLGDVKVDLRDTGVAFSASAIPAFRSEPASALRFEWDRFAIYGPPGKSWKDVGLEYLAEIKACLEAPAPTQAAQEAMPAADASLPLAERVHRISAYVQRTLAYRAVTFGPRAYIPRAPDDTLRTKFGDCKDHSVLLHSLLNQAGIKAHLALYSFGLPPLAEIPHRNAFDHMVVYVPDLHAPGAQSGGTFLDTTSDDLDAALQGHGSMAPKAALVLDPAEPRLVDVPLRDAPAEGVFISRDVLILADGKARIDERIEIAGRDSVSYRSRLSSMPPDERTNLFADWLGSSGKPAIVSSLRFERLDAIATGARKDDSLIVLVSYEIPGAFRRDGDALAGRVPMAFEHARVPVDAVPGRIAPVRLIRWRFESETRVRCEESLVAASLPGVFESRTAAGDGRVEWTTREAEGASPIPTIVRTLRFEDLPGLHPAQEWNAYSDLSQKVIDACERDLRFISRSKAPAGAANPAEPAR